jgi:hypothetical protein
MNAAIWYLPFKISGLVGGGGYHRGLLMDMAWQDLENWWVAGMPMAETARWFPYVHEVVGGADITNHFLVFAIRAGLPTVLLLIAVLTYGFKGVGSVLGSVRGRGDDEFLLWGMGVTLFVHAVSWLGISYFDQSNAVWLLHLAAVSSAVQCWRMHLMDDSEYTEFREAEPQQADASLPGDLAMTADGNG